MGFARLVLDFASGTLSGDICGYSCAPSFGISGYSDTPASDSGVGGLYGCTSKLLVAVVNFGRKGSCRSVGIGDAAFIVGTFLLARLFFALPKISAILGE
jgi:hypothetical protein